MNKIKKILILLIVFQLLFLSSAFPTFAVKYTDDLPSYVKYEGVSYFEVFDSSLGTVTCVFPIEFKSDTFGFILTSGGTPSNFLNVTNTTVNGLVITSNGTVYTARATRLSYIEYRLSSTSSTYTALRPVIAGMTNTNMNFVTSDSDYYNENYFDNTKFITAFVSLIFFCVLILTAASLLRRGRR